MMRVMDDFLPAPGTPSLQETLVPHLNCFGCGPANEKGLRIRSYLVDGQTRARFRPWPEHDNGGGYLNGGIISTLLDCHGAAAVIAEARRMSWEAAPGAILPFVTAHLDVSFRRPTPLDEELDLVAELVSATESEATVVSRIVFDGKERASATSVWKRWRARS